MNNTQDETENKAQGGKLWFPGGKHSATRKKDLRFVNMLCIGILLLNSTAWLVISSLVRVESKGLTATVTQLNLLHPVVLISSALLIVATTLMYSTFIAYIDYNHILRFRELNRAYKILSSATSAMIFVLVGLIISTICINLTGITVTSHDGKEYSVNRTFLESSNLAKARDSEGNRAKLEYSSEESYSGLMKTVNYTFLIPYEKDLEKMEKLGTAYTDGTNTYLKTADGVTVISGKVNTRGEDE